METRAPHCTLTALLFMVAIAGAGCSDTGPYVEAKDAWDSPPTNEELQDLRLRLALTQQDH